MSQATSPAAATASHHLWRPDRRLALRGAAFFAPALLAACGGAAPAPAEPPVYTAPVGSPEPLAPESRLPANPPAPPSAQPTPAPYVPAPAADLDALRQYLEALAAQASGTFGFYVHDLATDLRVGTGDDAAFPVASVIKLPIMLRLLEMVRDGDATLDQTVQLTPDHKTDGSGIFQFFQDGIALPLGDVCTAMIALSDNTATNMVLDVTGVDAVNDLLDRFDCPGTRLHGRFGGPENVGLPGPSQGVPSEIGRLLALLVRDQLLPLKLSEVAVTALGRQTDRALIPRFLPEGTPVANKTGSIDGVRHDAGIIWRPASRSEAAARRRETYAGLLDRRETYVSLPGKPAMLPIVFVGMSQDSADPRWTVENEAIVTIARAAKAVYDHFTAPAG